MKPFNSSISSPPKPEVQFLPTLFRRIQNGDIRIPEFQRGLVWNHEQIRALLENVYRSYPIGSLLLWTADTTLFKPFVPEAVNMPAPEELPPGKASYVLDGMQRLITLYAAFNGGGGVGRRFDLLFDLESEQFSHESPRRQILPTELRLSRVFLPRQFLEDQATLAKLPNPDLWLTKAVKLHSRFQEYALPIVTIEDTSPPEAVEIFTNINRRGSSLSTIDFMRALTWHDNFDLNLAVERIRNSLPMIFSPSDETLSKAIALMLGIDPLPDTILNLQSVPVEALEAAVDKAIMAINRAADFLRRTIGIASSDFVPYEGQLFVLIAVCAKDNWDESLDPQLLKWFIATSFSEALQGRPDHYIIKMVKAAAASLSAGHFGLEADLILEIGELARRQLRKGTAISSGFYSLLAINKARSIFTGEEIPRSDYMESFDASNFAAIGNTSNMRIRPMNANRQLMNLILLSRSEAYDTSSHLQILNRLEYSSLEVLSSQFLDHETVRLLKSGNYEEFVTQRARVVIRAITEFLDS